MNKKTAAVLGVFRGFFVGEKARIRRSDLQENLISQPAQHLTLRQALLASSALAALLIMAPVPVKALVIDIEPGVAVVDTALAQSIAFANDPVAAASAQTNTAAPPVTDGNLTQSTFTGFDLEATAIAVSGDIDITNTTIGDNTTGLSSATALATIAAAVAQRNENLPATTNDPTVAQVVTQTNGAELDLDATAIAVSGLVDIDSSGPVNTPGDGITATSVASATASVATAISQQNVNTLAQQTDPGIELVQSQTVTQRNEVREDIDATSIAVAGDVIVNRDGDTTAGGNGVNATSSATANSQIAKATT